MPSVVVLDIMSSDPDQTRKGLSLKVKKTVSHLKSHDKQGQLMSTTTSDLAPIWSHAIQKFPSIEVCLKFSTGRTPRQCQTSVVEEKRHRCMATVVKHQL